MVAPQRLPGGLGVPGEAQARGQLADLVERLRYEGVRGAYRMSA